MNLLTKTIKEIKVLIYMTFLVTVILSLMPFFLVNLFLRSIVWVFAKIFRPDLHSFVTGQHSIFALKHSNVATKNIIACFVLEGDISSAEFRGKVQERVFYLENSPDFKYGVLKQTFTSFMGWAFWKIDPKFELANHIRDYDYKDKSTIPNPCSEKDVNTIMGKLLKVPWVKDRSPWEILLIHNYQESGPVCTALIFRLNHAIGDGYSWMQFMKAVTHGEFAVPKVKLGERKVNIWVRLGMLLRIPYDLAKNALVTVGETGIAHQRKFLTEEVISVSPNVDVNIVKRIKNHFNVHYGAVICAAIFGAIERAFVLSGQKVPEKLISLFIIPLPNHPDGMCIHCALVVAEWPVRSASPTERLLKIQQNFKELNRSSAALGYYYVSQFGAFWPIFIRKLAMSALNLGVSVGVSNFPVTTAPDYFEGHEFLEYYGGAGTMPPVGICITTGGLNNRQRLYFSVSKSLFSSDEIIENMGMYAAQELQELLYETV